MMYSGSIQLCLIAVAGQRVSDETAITVKILYK